MKQIVKFIPNLLTLGNLFMGLLALVFIAREQMVSAVLCVAVALVLDFLDGFAARLLHAEAEMGKQLDSLADLVTFGVVPGFMLFQMIIITQGYYFVSLASWPIPVFLNAAIAGLVPLAGALRLARYNLDSGHNDHFLGMPIPAMSMFVFGIPIILEMQYHLNFYHPLSNQFIALLGEARRLDPSDILIVKMMFNTLFYQVLSVILATLMVSRIPMLSLKFKGLSWGKNKWSYGIIIWLAIAYLIFVIPYLGGYGLIDYLIIPIIMIGYFILSLIYATFGTSKERAQSDEV
tara:strand:+ start:1248 stop:2120 length:873 start_codon:yes stop_codon:yes gene_type:complete